MKIDKVSLVIGSIRQVRLKLNYGKQFNSEIRTGIRLKNNVSIRDFVCE